MGGGNRIPLHHLHTGKSEQKILLFEIPSRTNFETLIIYSLVERDRNAQVISVRYVLRYSAKDKKPLIWETFNLLSVMEQKHKTLIGCVL